MAAFVSRACCLVVILVVAGLRWHCLGCVSVCVLPLLLGFHLMATQPCYQCLVCSLSLFVCAQFYEENPKAEFDALPFEQRMYIGEFLFVCLLAWAAGATW